MYRSKKIYKYNISKTESIIRKRSRN